MALVLTNALLVDFDPVGVEAGALRIEGGVISGRGDITAEVNDEAVDCGGAVVLPGLVNGHTHLYSSLAVGMPPPAETPENFLEILQRVWWRLDQALDSESIEMSARIGAINALRCGTTTLIDHHASPNYIGGSLDLIERAIRDVGLRGVLCYETTDRHGVEGRHAGLDENRRYLARCERAPDGRFAGLVGAHASFTVEDETLGQLAELAADFETGVHIHVAEDPCDEEECQEEHQMFLIDRLVSHKLLKPGSVFAHCTHLDPEAMARVGGSGVTIAHNPRSNMNNGVGYTPVATVRGPIMLGTDGIGSDMLAEAKAAWFMSRHEHAGLAPMHIVDMLAESARRASRALGVTLGQLSVGAAADVVITDYSPFTPLTADNLGGHVLFAMGSQSVTDVLAGGEWALCDRKVQSCDEIDTRRTAINVASALWQRMVGFDVTGHP